MEKQSNTKENKQKSLVISKEERMLQEARQGKEEVFKKIKLAYHCFTTYVSFRCTTM